MSTKRIIRRAVRDVDELNEGAARELERRLMSAAVWDVRSDALTMADIGFVMGHVDDVLNPIYGADRVRAVQSSMFRSIVNNARIASDEALVQPFYELDRRLYEAYGREWWELRRKMTGRNDLVPTVFAEVAGDRRASKRLRILRRRLFDPQRRWVDPGGYRLSDRVWKMGVIHRRNIDRVLRRGIRRGDGPVTIAKSLREYLSPKAAPLTYASGGRILRKRRARGRFRDGQGASAARRLARTEVQRVAHEATETAMRELQKDVPRAAVRYSLSPAHPKIDICDEYAAGSSRGYPPGVYTPDEVPKIPHPNCLCSRRPWVPSREQVLRDLNRRYGDPVVRRQDYVWDNTGDASDYMWDATSWGDDVGWADDVAQAQTLGLDDASAYRLGYDQAKDRYLRERGRDLDDYLGDMYFGDAQVEVEPGYLTRLFELGDDEIDDAVMNMRSSIDILTEMSDFDDFRPRIVLSSELDFDIDPGTIMQYSANSNTIKVNTSHRKTFGYGLPLDNNDFESMAGRRFRDYVSDTPESSMLHEFGHTRHLTRMAREGRLVAEYDDYGLFEHYRVTTEDGRTWRVSNDIPGGGWNIRGSDLNRVGDEVSAYAKDSPLEFVAETYYGLVSGERYSDEIMDLYRYWGGVEPDASDIAAWNRYAAAREGGDELDMEDLFGDDDNLGVNPYDDFDDELFPETGAMSVDDLLSELDITQDEYDEIITYAIQRDMLGEEDFLDPTGGTPLDPSFIRLVMSYIEAEDF